MTQRLPVKIVGTGSYVPEEVITNQHFADYLDTSDEWIVTRTGIRERRRAAPDESSSSMAILASQAAMKNAGITIKDVDAIICATATGDCLVPATAAFIHAGLGAGNTPAFDISAACAGFLYGALTGASMISSGIYHRVLIVGAETLTRYADPQDRSMVVLFGDAAGAAILARADDSHEGFLYHEMGCDGTKTDYIWVPAGGSRHPASETTVAERLHFLRMRGREVYKFAVKKMQELIDRALKSAHISPEELTLLIPHQSNLRIIESAREKLNLPREKVAINIDRFGNTSAASIPMALDAAMRDGSLQEGDLVLMAALGAGLTWGTILMRI